ncbi:TIGR02444 family protein [Pseudorhodoplanes sp.]|uniref:TIGR02444 family protein n=1 Tax=Pseudorhodoplanes sp. TaxID=1934341 RepID=UPI00391E04D8
MAALETDNPFWRFSLRVYAEPGVAEECLAAQDNLGVDVNVLLFAAWLGTERGIALDRTGLARVEAAVAGWADDIVTPLRAVRRRLKQMPEIEEPQVQALRKRIAQIELSAEQIEQALLYRLSDEFGCASGSVAATGKNVAVVVAARSADPAQFQFCALLAACGAAPATD